MEEETDAPRKSLFLKLFFCFGIWFLISGAVTGSIDILPILLSSSILSGVITLVAWKVFKIREKVEKKVVPS